MNSIRTAIIAVIAGLVFAGGRIPAHAFLGEDYFRVKNGPVFAGKNVFSFLGYKYTARNQGSDSWDYWEIRPGLGYAFAEWIYLGLDCVIGKYGPEFLADSKKDRYAGDSSILLDSVEFDVILAMTDSGKVPVQMGIDFFYRCPTDRAQDVLLRDHSGGFTFILAEAYGKGHNSTVNLSYWRAGEKDFFQWAVGSAFQLAQSGQAIFKLGVEIFGDFSGHSAIIPGISTVISDSFSIKAGVLVGFSQYTGEHRHDGLKEDDLSFELAIVKKW
ncbi:MAG TPA: hypothetical protein PK926_17310 [Spirochaetota bacterium]|nr:hypothetical protein [Spirochaetota bacterium]HPI90840.1 hypothetical protein [Spirochaetota bacterium]HPR49867.1 hypothetical protein [Spirochaetota bacterium]